MEFTRDQLQVIESALEDTQDNTGDADWYGELGEVLELVRENLRQLKENS